MSIIYERLKTNVINEVYHSSTKTFQFQFLGDGNCVSVWNNFAVVGLMLESGGDVYSNGWVNSIRWIAICGDGEVS